MASSTRAWRQLQAEHVPLPTCEATLRFTLVLWAQAVGLNMSEAQRTWLARRLLDTAPLTPREHVRLVPHLLAWSRGQPWEDALVRGLRGVVAEELLPKESNVKNV